MSLPAILPALKIAMGAMGGLGTALQAGLAVGSTAMNFAAQNAQASAEEAAIRSANENARQQTVANYDQITRRAQQETAAAGAKLQETAVARKKAVASAEASASEAGVGGLGVAALLTDIYGQEARIRDGVNQNLEATKAELDASAQDTALQYQNTLLTRPVPQRPSAMGALLEAGTGIFGAYKDNLRTSAKVDRTSTLSRK